MPIIQVQFFLQIRSRPSINNHTKRFRQAHGDNNRYLVHVWSFGINYSVSRE
ncbi:hypothetical protein AG1IA_09513 [Rhizoctonia solani AG-1 IA]|uniref:Uncharacterized protein n=1 Tax=Thanatephorus cucumeris (strain AG1-IA) TaxID=983506 RepID=L8WIA5_THACA|nr:hypothetical protein AG1IA_09513 [Rhizoctonia solani AG-1 IA]